MIDGAQFHLLVNHLPVLGIPFTLLLLLFGMWRKSLEIKRLSMGALVLVGLLAIPAFKSGEAAEEIVEGLPGRSEVMIEEHEEFSEIAFWFLEGVAVLALLGLVYFRGPRRLPTWFTLLLLAGMVGGAGLMARTAHLGGQISHPEIRSNGSGVELPTHEMDDDDDDYDDD